MIYYANIETSLELKVDVDTDSKRTNEKVNNLLSKTESVCGMFMNWSNWKYDDYSNWSNSKASCNYNVHKESINSSTINSESMIPSTIIRMLDPENKKGLLDAHSEVKYYIVQKFLNTQISNLILHMKKYENINDVTNPDLGLTSKIDSISVTVTSKDI